MKKSKVLVVALVVLAVVAGIFFLKSGSSAGRQSSESVRIGAILPLTGPLSFLGQPQSAALEIARKELQSHGVQVALSVEDNKGDIAKSVAAAHKLISVDNVELAFVTTSAIANAVAPVFQEAGIPLVTICSDESIAKRYSYSVNFYVGIDDEIATIAAHLKAGEQKNISLLRVDASVTSEALNLLRTKYKDQLFVTNDETYKLGETVPRNSLEKIKASAPDALLLLGYGPEFPGILTTATEIQFDKPIIGNYSMASEGARKLGTSVLKKAAFTAFPIAVPELANSSFGKKFAEQTGEAPRQFLDYVFAYEALKIVGDYWQTHNKSLQGIERYFRGRTFDTLFGKFSIDGDGNGSLPMVMSKYNDEGLVTPLSR